MNTRMIVLFAVLAALFLLAFAVSRAVILHAAPQEQLGAPSRVSQADVKEGSDPHVGCKRA